MIVILMEQNMLVLFGIHVSFKTVWRTSGEDIQEFSGLNDAHFLATDNTLSLLLVK